MQRALSAAAKLVGVAKDSIVQAGAGEAARAGPAPSAAAAAAVATTSAKRAVSRQARLATVWVISLQVGRGLAGRC